MLYNVSILSLGEKSGRNINTCTFKPDNLHLLLPIIKFSACCFVYHFGNKLFRFDMFYYKRSRGK